MHNRVPSFQIRYVTYMADDRIARRARWEWGTIALAREDFVGDNTRKEHAGDGRRGRHRERTSITVERG